MIPRILLTLLLLWTLLIAGLTLFSFINTLRSIAANPESGLEVSWPFVVGHFAMIYGVIWLLPAVVLLALAHSARCKQFKASAPEAFSRKRI